MRLMFLTPSPVWPYEPSPQVATVPLDSRAMPSSLNATSCLTLAGNETGAGEAAIMAGLPKETASWSGPLTPLPRSPRASSPQSNRLGGASA